MIFDHINCNNFYQKNTLVGSYQTRLYSQSTETHHKVLKFSNIILLHPLPIRYHFISTGKAATFLYGDLLTGGEVENEAGEEAHG